MMSLFLKSRYLSHNAAQDSCLTMKDTSVQGMQAPAGGIPGFTLAHTSLARSHSWTDVAFICVLAESQGASWQDLPQQPGTGNG